MTDIVNLHLMPGPAGKPQGSVALGVDGDRRVFRRGGVVQMPRSLAEAYARKYNPLTGDFRGITFRIEDLGDADPAPAMSANVGELQSTVAALAAQVESLSGALTSLAAQNKDLFAKLSEKDGLTVHPKPASAADSVEAANAAKAKPKKGVQAMTTATFKTGEEG